MYLEQQNSVLQMDLEAREHQLKDRDNKIFQLERVRETDLKKNSEFERKWKEERDLREQCERLLNDERLEKERMKAKMREKMDSERVRLKGIFERLLAEKQAELEREQCIPNDKLNAMKRILNADDTNWEIMRENPESFYPVSGVRPSGGPSFPSNGIDSQASTRTPQQFGTPLAINQCIGSNTNKSSTPQTFGSVGPEGLTLHNPPPVVNPRHRRSLSSGNEKWIDHRPPGTIDLGTVLRPNIKNKKSVSNLKAADVLKDASKYALTHHEADDRGQVETLIYKGEVIPSSSGGAQVIFNDVETLKQESPSVRFDFILNYC
jgi:kinesin family protein 23